MTDPVSATGRPIIFYAPHQDDETLFMGQIIAHHALAGRQVHVVLATDGSTTQAINSLNGVAGNGWWGGYHYPEREGYDLLTPMGIACARDRELIAACGQLGVRPENIHLEPFRYATITQPEAEALITRYDDLYPDAGHYTMWYGDIDTTHKALGQALQALTLADPIRFNDTRWTVRTEQHAEAGTAYVVPVALQAEVKRMTLRASYAYRSWAPRQGMYAVGYHSVGLQLFPQLESGDPNWIVKVP